MFLLYYFVRLIPLGIILSVHSVKCLCDYFVSSFYVKILLNTSIKEANTIKSLFDLTNNKLAFTRLARGNALVKRGRDFEKTIRIDYLTGLNKRYESWINDYKG